MEKSIVYEMSQSESLIMNFLWREGAKTFVLSERFLSYRFLLMSFPVLSDRRAKRFVSVLISQKQRRGAG